MKPASPWVLLAFAGVLSAPAVSDACTCGETSVEDALRSADVVFAGTVESVVDVDPPTDWEPRIIVTFDVARVWKGDVGPSFTMHTNDEASSCSGFFREMLDEGPLLVYAYGRPASRWKSRNEAGGSNARSFTIRGDESEPLEPDAIRSLPDDRIVYTTDICTRTTPVLYAVDDFDRLGKAREFAPLSTLPDRVLVESLKPRFNEAPPACGGLTNAKVWRVLGAPPENAPALRALLDDDPHLTIPSSPLTTYRELWFASEDGRFGFCRAPAREDIYCGRVDMQFVPTAEPAGWRIGEGGISTYCPDAVPAAPR